MNDRNDITPQGFLSLSFILLVAGIFIGWALATWMQDPGTFLFTLFN